MVDVGKNHVTVVDFFSVLNRAACSDKVNVCAVYKHRVGCEAQLATFSAGDFDP